MMATATITKIVLCSRFKFELYQRVHSHELVGTREIISASTHYSSKEKALGKQKILFNDFKHLKSLSVCHDCGPSLSNYLKTKDLGECVDKTLGRH